MSRIRLCASCLNTTAQRVASLGAEGFVDNLFREVSALRSGQKQCLWNDTKDVGTGADTARPFELEPSVTERLYKMSLKAVGKNTWDHNSHPCLTALKHATKAIEVAQPPAATVKQPTEESTGNAATVEE